MSLANRSKYFTESSPAASVIAKCGGVRPVAEMLGIHITSVYRFSYPKSMGGQEGLIPMHYAVELIARARDRGIQLTPLDFFPRF
jgi:hypothetical protein